MDFNSILSASKSLSTGAVQVQQAFVQASSLAQQGLDMLNGNLAAQLGMVPAVTSSYRDRMATASWRGFEFLTDSHDAKGGQRLVVHEYPGADQPLVEDFGAKAWDLKLNAYFIGADYDLERNKLLGLLAAGGAAWLKHPWLGDVWVRAKDWSLQESNDKGGYCGLAIDFVPGGEQPALAEADRVDVAASLLSDLGDAIAADFSLEAMSATGMGSLISAAQAGLEGVRGMISMASLPLTWASQIQQVASEIKGDLNTLLTMPATYASAVRGLTDIIGLGAVRDQADDQGVGAVVAEFPDNDRPRVIARIASSATPGSTAFRENLAFSNAALLSGNAGLVMAGIDVANTTLPPTNADPVVRRNLVREAALRTRLMVVAAGQIALADYRAEEHRDAALNGVVVALDMLLPTLPDPVFQLALSTRSALIAALMAQDLRPTTTRDVVGPLPAVVLAHRLGVDASVFLARNDVRHPLFVTGRVYG